MMGDGTFWRASSGDKLSTEKVLGRGEVIGEATYCGVASPAVEVLVEQADEAIDSEDGLLPSLDDKAFLAVSRFAKVANSVLGVFKSSEVLVEAFESIGAKVKSNCCRERGVGGALSISCSDSVEMGEMLSDGV
jgi:hypothetical protein